MQSSHLIQHLSVFLLHSSVSGLPKIIATPPLCTQAIPFVYTEVQSGRTWSRSVVLFSPEQINKSWDQSSSMTEKGWNGTFLAKKFVTKSITFHHHPKKTVWHAPELRHPRGSSYADGSVCTVCSIESTSLGLNSIKCVLIRFHKIGNPFEWMNKIV